MGWRFRKSVKVFPGVRVNLDRDGISSVSAGGRGARASVGKRGVRQTVSLPGSGLSYRVGRPNRAESYGKEPDFQPNFSFSLRTPMD
ncbi:DUF4236 domain-containing protein (plasmid) [Skermanella sp. TT6]|mgnify:CR=1 FL=1|uniref:DUF4236 domain-containing protein n=1 Tax=Skermanella cutis TaxID=2775420 RepID=A0ABX7BLY9_9PROT|nr:DUF4236 domain-containing protein [Skermanella sp. TT6]QQP93992.1 DUF4236 domain-containing protein [Skermanella sp. TT6]